MPLPVFVVCLTSMSLSMLRRLLARLLSRFLDAFLPYVRRLPPHKLINHLFAFLASIRRWTYTNTCQPTLHQRQGPFIRSATQNNGTIYAMNVPSAEPSNAQERSPPSLVDLPYLSPRSPSGDHLMPPASPTPTRGYSRHHMSWMTSNQTPLYEEPGSPIDHDTSHTVADCIPRSSSSTTIHTDYRSPTPGPNTPPSRPHTPPHAVVGFAPETSLGNPGTDGHGHAAHIHFNPIELEPYRSKTPLSMMSSQRSISHRSHKSGVSIGRASYREHHGPPGRPLTPIPDQSAPHPPLSSPLGKVEPGLSAPIRPIIAPPKAGDPGQPGEPVVAGLRFFPMSVNGVLRYENRKIRPPLEHDYNIEAMLHEYPETPEPVPEGWTAYRHPEGALYFVHDKSKTFTEVDLCNREIHEDIEHFRSFLFAELKSEINDRNLSESFKTDEVQLVLEPKVDKDGVMCCYYFVNPRARSLFWLNEWEGYEIFKDVKGVLSPAHKGLAIQAQYWCVRSLIAHNILTLRRDSRTHWNLYPNFCQVTQELKDEIVDMILHATCDHLTSNLSSLPLNPEELKNHLCLIEKIIPKKARKTKARGHSAVIIGRIMHIFYYNYFLNFHGEDCARLNFDQPVHGWRYHPSWRMAILAPLLFMTPVNNVRLLHRVFVDDIASKEKWNMFVSKLHLQLQETSVLATVLLNANVGFLPKQSGTGALPQQYLSYMSLVASMASIILSLVFMGHGRTEERNTPFKAATFLHGLRHKRHGLEKLAIIYSLPHAFLMWGMVLFSAAFAVQWCYPINTTSRTCVGIFMLIVAFLAAWCIWTVRDRYHFWWFQPDPEEKEYEEEREDQALLVVSKLGFLRKLTTTLHAPKSSPDWSYITEDTTSHHGVLNPPLTSTLTAPVPT